MEYESRDATPLSVTVVRAVSAEERRPLRSLPPLYDAVDPDALDSLFAPGHRDSTDQLGSVSFPFSDSFVTVEASGRIVVELGADRPSN